MARILGPKFTAAWGQQVVVEERGGGGGMISAETVARASPDGYTLLLATGTHTINPNFLQIELRHDARFRAGDVARHHTVRVVGASSGAGEPPWTSS